MKNTQNNRKTVPIFFAVDDNYAPYLTVALESLKDNASDKYFYDINILIEGLSERYTSVISSMQEDNIKILLVRKKYACGNEGGSRCYQAIITHSSTLAWRIPWTEEPGRLQSMGSPRVGDNGATTLSLSPHSVT